MRIPLPNQSSPEVYDSFRSIEQELSNQNIPLIRDKKNLSHIRDGTSAYYSENGKLYLYTKQNGKMFRFATGDVEALLDRIAALEKFLSSLESNQSDTNYNIATRERLDDYERGVDASSDLYRFIGIGPPDNLIESQSERPLSPLERSVIEFVFGEDVLNPDNICVIISEIIGDDTTVGTYRRSDNRIRIAKKYLPNTSNEINGDSTLENTDLLDPGNLEYLGIFVHEVAHRWQEVASRTIALRFLSKFNNPDKVYDFDESDLDDFQNLSTEQHASILEVWFGINWQLNHAPPDGTMIDLTNAHHYEGTGAFNRYARIANIPLEGSVNRSFDDGNAEVSVPKRFISHEVAEDILDDLQPIIDRTRSNSRFIFSEDSKPTSPSSTPSGYGSNLISGLDAPAVINVADLIKTRYESNADTNAFTDALLTKLNTIPALRNAAETYELIQNLLDYNDLSNKPIIPTLRTASQTFDLIENMLPEGIELRNASQTYALIQNLLNYNDLSDQPTIPTLRTAQQTFNLIESLLPEGIMLRDAADTYALIQNLLNYNDLSNLPTIPTLRTAQQTFDLIENLLPEVTELRTAVQTYTLIQSLLSYNDLSDRPTIPTLRNAQQTFDLIEDLLPEVTELRNASQTYALIQSLLNYNDLSNRPTIPTLRNASQTYSLVQSLLNYNDLSNRPTIPTLRTAAQTYALIENLLDYNDLSNKPTILSESEVCDLILDCVIDILPIIVTWSDIPDQTAVYNVLFSLDLKTFITGTLPVVILAEGLPPGLSITDGVIAGQSTAVGTHTVDVVAINPAGAVSADFDLTVTMPLAPVWEDIPDQELLFNIPFTFNLNVYVDGEYPINIFAPGLPAGLFIANGQIVGQSIDTDPHEITVSATNDFGSDETTFGITILTIPRLYFIDDLTNTAEAYDLSRNRITALDIPLGPGAWKGGFARRES